jgi:arginyl-tRNA synthetase
MTSTLKHALAEALLASFDAEHEIALGRPPPGHGDFSWCATQSARALGVNPVVLAERVAQAISAHDNIEKAEATGPYVNIWCATLFADALGEAPAQSLGEALNRQRIMVEYLSPNTNKPLHLGHVRNGVIGTAVANLLRAAGHTVVLASLVNDRGIHICKSMAAYEAFGRSGTPETMGVKGDHFVGDYYVAFQRAHEQDAKTLVRNGMSEAEAEKNTPIMLRAQELLQKWESGDEYVRELWQRMNGWVYDGFGATYRRYGFSFDTLYYESELYTLGKDIVEDGVARGIFVRRPDGSVAYPLPTEEFGKDAKGNQRSTTLLRSDGTSLYTTQDLGVAVRKAEEWGLDRSIYVVACEQDHHFESLFSMLKALGYPWADRCYHLSYQMVELPEGRMKSREGTVVDADDLAEEMKRLALDALVERGMERGVELTQDELVRRADLIGLAAIKFFLLGFGPNKKILFDPKKSLSFEGDTGPYCLYTYARIQSIRAKAHEAGLEEAGTFEALGTDDERALALDLIEFPHVVAAAAEEYNPTPVAKKTLALARAFNRFYRTHHVLGSDAKLSRERLALIRAVGNTLQRGLSLLGIETLERM